MKGHHKPTKGNKTQTIYKGTHIMHSLIDLTHKRESQTRKKKTRVCCWREGHHKPAKRNKTQTIITHITQEGPSLTYKGK